MAKRKESENAVISMVVKYFKFIKRERDKKLGTVHLCMGALTCILHSTLLLG